MIRTIDIRLNAAHPELPLPEATTYQNAPSTAFLRGVPKSCGLWRIAAVNVAVTFPDNSTTTRAAVLSAGDVWVATIPACATSGRTASGLRILADGIDENGDAVTGYVLGVADFAVATFDIAPAPGVTSYALRYFDNVPNPPHKGDVAKIGGVLKYYDGTAWQVFADVDLSNYATKADATLAERGYSAWELTSYPSGIDAISDFSVSEYGGASNVYTLHVSGHYDDGDISTDFDTNSIEPAQGTDTGCSFDCGGPWGLGSFVVSRTALQGYQLGSQASKPLASEAEAEALRTAVAAKYAKPSGGIPATDLAAAVQASLGKADTALQEHQQLSPVYGPTSSATWTITYSPDYSGDPVQGVYFGDPAGEWGEEQWYFSFGGYGAPTGNTNPNASTLTYAGITATRTDAPVSYQLGTQTDKPLATAAQGALAQTAVQPSALPASETWTFEVDDGQGGTTTVTKSVAVYAAGGNA